MLSQAHPSVVSLSRIRCVYVCNTLESKKIYIRYFIFVCECLGGGGVSSVFSGARACDMIYAFIVHYTYNMQTFDDVFLCMEISH